MRPLRIVSAVAVVLVTACLLACGGIRQAAQKAAEQAQKQNDLMQIGMMYHNFLNQNKRPPSGPQDLQKVAGSPDDRAHHRHPER
jgi:hypothetical protein